MSDDYHYDERELVTDAICGCPVPEGGVMVIDPPLLVTYSEDLGDNDGLSDRDIRWHWDRKALAKLTDEGIFKLYVALKVHRPLEMNSNVIPFRFGRGH